jgi:hypothetical protein
MLLENFEAKSSLPGDDGVVVESVDQSKVILFALRDRLFVGLVIVGAVQDDFCTVGACCRDLRERRGERHDNTRIDLVASGVIGDTLRMIAGGGRDHTVGAFFLIERKQFVQGTALFEGTGALLVVELEEDGIVGEAGEGFRVSAGRDADVGANPVEGGLDVGELDHYARPVIFLLISAGSRYILAWCTMRW